MQLRRTLLAVSLGLVVLPAAACDIAVPTPGILALSSNGQSLSSSNPGGLATVIVISSLSILSSTTITISNTRLDQTPGGFNGPVGYAASYTAVWALGSASGSLTNNPSFTVPPVLNLAVTITLHNSVTTTTGFRQGNYTTKTSVTCT